MLLVLPFEHAFMHVSTINNIIVDNIIFNLSPTYMDGAIAPNSLPMDSVIYVVVIFPL